MNYSPEIVKGSLTRESLHQAMHLQQAHNLKPERIYVSAQGEKTLALDFEVFGIGFVGGYQPQTEHLQSVFCNIPILVMDGMPDGHFLMISREAFERASHEAVIYLKAKLGFYG